MFVQIGFILSTVVFWLSMMFWIMSALTLNAAGMFWYGLVAILSGAAMRLLMTRG